MDIKSCYLIQGQLKYLSELWLANCLSYLLSVYQLRLLIFLIFTNLWSLSGQLLLLLHLSFSLPHPAPTLPIVGPLPYIRCLQKQLKNKQWKSPPSSNPNLTPAEEEPGSRLTQMQPSKWKSISKESSPCCSNRVGFLLKQFWTYRESPLLVPVECNEKRNIQEQWL